MLIKTLKERGYTSDSPAIKYPKKRWLFESPGVHKEHLLFQNVVIISINLAGEDGSINSALVGVDSKTGEELWRFESTEMLTTPTAFQDSRMIVVGESDSVVALDVASGAEKWRQELNGGSGLLSRKEIIATVKADEDIYAIRSRYKFLGRSGTEIYILDGNAGGVKEKYDLQPTAFSPVFRSAKRVYAHTQNGLWILDHDGNCSTLEKFGRVCGYSVAEGEIFIRSTTDGGTLYALSSNNNSVKWSYHVGGEDGFNSPSITTNTVFARAVTSDNSDGELVALDRNTGNLKWSRSTDQELFIGTEPVATDDSLYLVDDSSLTSYNPRTGDVLWELQVTMADQTDQWWGRPSPTRQGLLIGGAEHSYFIEPSEDETDTLIWRGDDMLEYREPNPNISNQTRELTENLNYCESCGTNLQEYSDPNYCPKCGTILN